MSAHADGASPGPPATAQPSARWSRGAARFRPRRGAGGPLDEAAGSRDELVAEVLLLREENARLKAEAHEAPSLGRLVARARALPAAQLSQEDIGDEAAHMLLEGLVLREALLAVCHELERSVGAVEARLAEMGDPTAPDGPALLRPVEAQPGAPTDAVDAEVGDGPGTP